jgi:glycosyltransferase involved in cell wall biosynthesis
MMVYMTLKETPQITVVIPTYNRAKLLKRAINSVLNQTYPNFQICVYDNHSKDQTESTVKKLAKKDSRVRYHKHKKNLGGIANWIYGMKHVNTPYFTVLCDDDIYLPNFFETVIKGFKKHPDAMMSIGLNIIMNENGVISRVSLPSWEKEGYYTTPEGFFQSIKDCPAWIPIIFKKTVIKKIGTMDLNLFEIDLDYIWRITSKFPFVISKKECSISTIHSNSSCEKMNSKLIYPDYFKICDKIYKDKKIHEDIKKKAKILFNDQFKKMALSKWLRDIKRKDFKDAHKIQEILYKKYKTNLKLIIMRSILKTVEYSPIAWSLFTNIIIKLRNSIFNTNKLQKEYGKYSKYLKYN